MKIDSALKEFVEKYDKKAIDSIDKISQEYGLVIHESTMPLFTLKEGFDKFNNYIRGYSEYMVENVNNDKRSPQDIIDKSANDYIEKELFKESDVKYKDLPSFIESFITGINETISNTDECRKMMVEAEIDPELVGNISNFTEKFMDRLYESFNPAMESILRASGYTTSKNLTEKYQPKQKVGVFL